MGHRPRRNQSEHQPITQHAHLTRRKGEKNVKHFFFPLKKVKIEKQKQKQQMKKKIMWFVLSVDRMFHWAQWSVLLTLLYRRHEAQRWNGVDGNFRQWVEMFDWKLKRGNVGGLLSLKAKQLWCEKPVGKLCCNLICDPLSLWEGWHSSIAPC